MYLLDTNIWIELLLEQEKANDIINFLNKIDTNKIYISEFTIYSIGIILYRYKKIELFEKFIRDLFIETRINRVIIKDDEFLEVYNTIKNFNLDFDDAYQFVCVTKNNLIMISYDRDFDKTSIDRKTPLQILNEEK